jgi:hypothetical protein
MAVGQRRSAAVLWYLLVVLPGHRLIVIRQAGGQLGLLLERPLHPNNSGRQAQAKGQQGGNHRLRRQLAVCGVG